MYVACPACKSLYAIQLAHLRAAGGELHCGACGVRFNATAAVFEQPLQALEYAEQHQRAVASEIEDLVDRALGEVAQQPAGMEPEPQPAADQTAEQPGFDVDEAVAYHEVVQQDVEEPPESQSFADQAGGAYDVDFDAAAVALADEPATDGFNDVAAPSASPQIEAGQEPLPEPVISPEQFAKPVTLQVDRDFVAQPARAEFSAASDAVLWSDTVPATHLLVEEEMPEGSALSWGALAASLLLILLLCGQLVWHERQRLATSDSLRPAMELFCNALRCDLPLRREPGSVEMVQREVRDHPRVAGALLINAAFVNRTGFPLAYPVFQISFSNVSGTLVAIRRFAPEEYLEAGQNSQTGMLPGEQTRVSLEVVDPGEQAVSFQFEFF